ncbi:hypothetical protein EV714DRAFT_202099 [Schizophyllum commune]
MMRSALKHSASRPSSQYTPSQPPSQHTPSRPPSPTSPSDSPMISRVPLPSSPEGAHATLPGASTSTLGTYHAGIAHSSSGLGLSGHNPHHHAPGTLSNLPTPTFSTPGGLTPGSASAYGGLTPGTPGPHSGLHTPIALPSFSPKVSFDTFENPAASMFSFTLSVKSEGYTRTRSTRVFLCAASADESGREALEWSLETLAQDGDELIVCRGVEEEVLEKDHDEVREEARQLMMEIQAKSVEYDEGRKLSLILEYVPTRSITSTLDRLIALYRPDSVVVGTRGKRTWTNALGGSSMGVGSVSKYCLSHSPVPVIVVRPERKVSSSPQSNCEAAGRPQAWTAL